MRIHWKIPRVRKPHIAIFAVLITVVFVVNFLSRDTNTEQSEDYLHLFKYNRHAEPNRLEQPVLENVPVVTAGHRSGEYVGPFPDSKAPEGAQLELIDYHDHVRIQAEKERTGLGEQGKAAKVPEGMKAKEDELYRANGFNGLLSDYIALDRALPDIRHPTCASYKYYKDLPTVSVVIPFFEEHLSTLKRTVVSVVNRSPPHLLREIILVDDGSFVNRDLQRPLEEWLQSSMPLVRLLRLPERVGLIMARQTGAKAAVGDVIIVLDSHCEVMTNWLPPLLHPIAENYRTAVCPLIDVISWDTFAYRPQDDGARGGFDWHFFYKRIPLSQELAAQLPKPFPNPVMNGGLFAISKKFFWELGGYDPELSIWGGEQYDLSFKIWQCGGRMLDAPCSRVGHVFRGAPSNRPAAKGKGDFISKNFKRVALVWMDEYIEALYRKKPSMRSVNAGDVSSELALREKLQCKPFSWFLETVAPDLVKLYPPFEDPDYANGTIKNVATGTCMDTGGKQTGNLIAGPCHGSTTQQFAWCWRKFIRVPNDQFCIESGPYAGRSPLLYNCNNNNSPAKQRWTYDPDTKLLRDDATHRCIEAKESSALQMSECSANNPRQQWLFQNLNIQRIRQLLNRSPS